jgi:hypothetical protein
MPNSSILGGEQAPTHAKGHDTDTLGPSDSSDSGSDVQGERAMPTEPDQPDEYGALPVQGGSDSDSLGTGERGSATGRDRFDNADILPDHIVRGPDASDAEFIDTEIEELADSASEPEDRAEDSPDDALEP